jgi:hypothetical protein
VNHDLIWLQPDEEIPESERYTVQSEKVMITIFWNLSCFHLIRLPSKDLNFNASYCVPQILDPFSVWRGTQIGRTNRKLIMHPDDARSRTAKVTLDFMERNAMKRALHPPYSPDLTPSDFALFGYVKQLLRGYESTNREAFLYPVEDISRGIEKVILENVFLS